MAGLVETMGGFLPSFKASSILVVSLWILGGLLFGCLCFGIGWWIIKKKKFNKTFWIFREFGGRPSLIKFEKAMFERIGLAGDYWARTWSKRITQRPRFEIGRNIYFMFEREDGELINFTFDNINDLMRKAGVKFLDEDVRLARIAIERNLRDRFEKQGFWEKYGTYIAFGILIIMQFFFALVIIRELGKVTEGMQLVASAFSSSTSMCQAAKTAAVTTGVIPI